MKIVIQCAAKKHPDAGFMTTKEGKQVLFVADPDKAPTSDDVLYVKPDNDSGDGRTWRELLLAYNKHPKSNSLNLYPAYKLYMNGVYSMLVSEYGADNIYILSAGWGLIGAKYLTPKYDITFSQRADPYKRRRKPDQYDDVCMLPKECDEELVFFGGKDYLPLFCELSKDYMGNRCVFYNSAVKPDVQGCKLIRYYTTIRTNWHYACIKAFLDGKIKTI